MVHFTQSHPAGLFHSAPAVRASRRAGYPIRQSADHGICAPTRGFSQLITAFFARQLQGIRHKPVLRLTILLAALRKTAEKQLPYFSLFPALHAPPSLLFSNIPGTRTHRPPGRHSAAVIFGDKGTRTPDPRLAKPML